MFSGITFRDLARSVNFFFLILSPIGVNLGTFSIIFLPKINFYGITFRDLARNALGSTHETLYQNTWFLEFRTFLQGKGGDPLVYSRKAPTWKYCINNVSIFHSQCDCSGRVTVGGHKVHVTWKYCMNHMLIFHRQRDCL